MQELKTILEEINRTTVRANAKVDRTKSNTVQAMLGRKRSAELRLPELRREYKNELRNRILPIVVVGSLASEFLSAAAEKIGAVTVDGEQIYKDLLSRMPSQSYSGKMSAKVIVDILSSHFMDLAVESDVVSYPAIIHNNRKSFSIKSKSDLEKLIKLVLNSSVGAEFTLIHNLSSISQKAIEMEFSSKVLPVLVGISDESLIEEVLSAYKKFSGRTFLLTAGEIADSLSKKALVSVDSVTEESVSSALKKVKTALKGKKGE